MKMRVSVDSLITRVVFGAIFALAVIGSIFLGIYGFAFMLLMIIVFGSLEFYRIAKLRGYKPHSVIGILSSLALFGYNIEMQFCVGEYREYLLLIFVLTIPAMFIAELFSGSKTPIGNLGSTLLSLIYVSIPMILLCNVVMLLCGGEWNSLLVLAYIFIMWANDSFAYLVGVTCGRHPMLPSISPKKSWEGFFGGVVGALIFGVVAALLFDENYYVWGGLALLASVSGVLGDLVESMFKRSVDIKDSGNVLPGHGGWLDRFDAFLISTPIIYVYLYLLNLLDVI